MNYYHEEKNVEEYIRLAKGYEGQKVINELILHLPEHSSLLELGMGPGTDLENLQKTYKATGSDYSEIFIERYRKTHPSADLLVLDALTLSTDQKFQCIYSNKVLMHLTRSELSQSIKRQVEILEPRGIICHSFWWGEKEENYDGLLFVYYTTKELQRIFSDSFQVLKVARYQEFEPDDSIYIIGRKKDAK